MQTPSWTRPQRPLRWSALDCEMGLTGRLLMRVSGRYWAMRASPVSMTYRIPGMVSDVSATFVATTIFGSRTE